MKIQPKFAKYLEACYRIKLQYLQGTMSYKDTTKLGGKGMGGGGGGTKNGGGGGGIFFFLQMGGKGMGGGGG